MKSFFYKSALVLSLTIMSCSKDEPKKVEPVNEEELITTVKLSFEEPEGSKVILLSKDLDGDGPGKPVTTQEGAFLKNKTYSCSVAFLNEAANPVQNITEEIVKEGADHQVFYKVEGLPSFKYNMAKENLDANGKPIGIKTLFTTQDAAKGNLEVILKHKLNKAATGVSDGDIKNAGGGTDAQATFAITIQ